MTGRRIFFILIVLFFSLATQASAASYPLIVQLGPLSSITTVVSTLGGTLVDSIPGANTYLLNVPLVPSSTVASLLGIQVMELNTGVTLPSFVQVGVLALPPGVPADWYKSQPSMLLIRSGNALQYSRGRGVVVADINSKVDVGHQALIGHLTTGYDFVTNKPTGTSALNQSSASFVDQSSASFVDQSSASFVDQSSASFVDQSSASFVDTSSLLGAGNPAYSHGTMCAGIIAAVAPDSMIMPLRAFDDQGSADIFTLAKAIRYAVQQGAQVVNMSFGTLQNSPTLKSAVTYALGKNVVLVASAGNNNTSAPQYPAAFSGVITTGATDLLDKKASFSNYGSSLYVDAPGTNIFSSYPGGYYSFASGTSFSAPAIAGTVALVRSLKATGVGNSIAAGAINIDSKNPNYVHQLGYGRIDVLNAVKN
jgi:subtilisin family serine protease